MQKCCFVLVKNVIIENKKREPMITWVKGKGEDSRSRKQRKQKRNKMENNVIPITLGSCCHNLK